MIRLCLVLFASLLGWSAAAVAGDTARKEILPILRAPLAHPGVGPKGRVASMEVRLETHLTSFASVPGTSFRTVVVAPARVGRSIVIPQGSLVFGEVRRSRSVGIGIRRERAELELDFHEYQLPDGRRFPFRASLTDVDNAREEVTDKGRIKGVLAAANPHGLVSGIWHRPNLGLFQKSALGMTGAAGTLGARLSLGPGGAAGLFALRIALLRLPDPEIHLAPGTDLKLNVLALPPDAPSFESPAPSSLDRTMREQLEDVPFEVTRTNGKLTADLINVAFVGSEEALTEAFQNAGWFPADVLTRRSFSLSYRAWTTMTGYPTAPVSALLYQNRKPDLVFQKSLNSVAKRHHLRIWDAGEIDGRRVWLAAATHDIGIVLNRRKMSLTHKISPFLDEERAKVGNDLSFAGCIGSTAFVPRESAVRTRQGSAVSDGKLAVLTLRPCSPPPALSAGPAPRHRPSALHRLTRRVTLEARHYVLRGNVYFWAYKTLRPARRLQPEPVIEE